MKKGIDNKGFRAFPQSVQMNTFSNMKYGSKMYNNGGPLLTEFNEGGSHEENPLGGIPQGIGANNQMNVVEEGETKFEDYIYSDQLKLDAETAEEFNLPKKYVGKTFADISKLMNKPNSRREDDSIETADKERNLAKLRDAQEVFKQAEVEAKLAEIDQLDPTAIPSLMQQASQQQGAPGGLEGEMMQQQLSPEEIAMAEQQAMMEQQAMEGQPIMAYGGPLSSYAFGGYSNSFESGGKLPKEILRARAKSHMFDAEADAYVDSYSKGGSMNFKSNAAYKKWLGYGHASGEFKKTPGHTAVSIKGEPKKVEHGYGGSMNAYEMGGMMNQNMMPIQSYRAGGNCYKCGGKMYGQGGNMYTTGGQLMAGTAGTIAGLVGNIPVVGGTLEQGVRGLYNKLDKEDNRDAQEARIFQNAADTVGLGTNLATGNFIGAGQDALNLISNNADLNSQQQQMINAGNLVAQGLNVGKSLLGKYAPTMLQDTPINVVDGEYDVSGMLPDDFAYGGKLNSFVDGGDLGDEEKNKYLVRSEPYINNAGETAYRDIYKLGSRQVTIDRQPGESIMSQKEIIDYAKSQGLISKPTEADRKMKEQEILDERQKQSMLDEAERTKKLVSSTQPESILDLTSTLTDTPMDDDYVPMAKESESTTTPSPEAPVGGILSLDEVQKYNPDVEAWDPNAEEEDPYNVAMRKMLIQQGPMSALASYAPMAYNLYQGLSPVDKVYTSEDFFTEISPDLVDYGESRKQATQLGAGLMREARNKGVNPLLFQSAYHAGLGNIRKIAEAEANKNAEILQANKKFNRQLKTKAKIQAEELNIKGRTARQEHMKEFIKGFYDNQKAQDANRIAAMYANMMNPNVSFEYQSYNPFRGLFNQEEETEQK